MRKIKNILILAGGDSSRFWPLKNKALFKFLDKSLLKYQIETFKKIGDKVFVVTNAEMYNSVSKLNNKIRVILQKNPNGMAGAVLSSKKSVKGEALIVNATDVFNQDSLYRCIDTLIYPSYAGLQLIGLSKQLRGVYTRANSFASGIQSFPDIGLLAKKTEDYFPGGYFKFKDKKVIEIVEKPSPNKIPSNKVRLVVDYLNDFSKLTQALETTKTQKDDLYEKGINNFLQQNIKINLVEYDDFWHVLKYPWHVLLMMNHFLKILNKQVKLGQNVKIAKSAKIVGPCFIGDNTVIGDFVMIRQSHIGKNCVIGGYSEVTRSYLGDNVSLHRNYIGDSVLADNVSFGAQAATANFRFDKKSVKSVVGKDKIETGLAKLGAIIGEGSKVGVNCTILPGVKIGRNTFIAPGETVYEDVKDNVFILKGNIANNTLAY